MPQLLFWDNYMTFARIWHDFVLAVQGPLCFVNFFSNYVISRGFHVIFVRPEHM